MQDPAARLVSLIAGVQPGQRVLDVCAAPGGKSFSAAFAMGDKGRIISCDVHGSKLKRIEEGAARLGLTSIETAASDGRVFRPEWADAYDTVLVDAPCSGLGIIRKKPDVRYKRADDLFTLPVVQTALLDNAARYVAPGGVLVYSTCTILPEENQNVADAFLSEHPDFERTPFRLPEPAGQVFCHLTAAVLHQIAEQLLLGHDPEPVIPRQSGGQQNRIPVAGMVGDQQCPVAGQVFKPFHGYRVKQPGNQQGNRVNQVEKRSKGLRCPLFMCFVHWAVLSRMIFKSA